MFWASVTQTRPPPTRSDRQSRSGEAVVSRAAFVAYLRELVGPRARVAYLPFHGANAVVYALPPPPPRVES